MKLSTIINQNTKLKAKINQELINRSKTNTLTNDLKTGITTKGKQTIKLDDSLNTKINQELTSNNFISAPLTENIKPTSRKTITSGGLNSLIYQTDDMDKIMDDGKLKGGYRVVNTITERNNIACCYRKLGMIVMVVGPDLSFTEYMLTGELCSNDGWVLYQIDTNDQIVLEDDVILTEDYSILDPSQQIETQRDLNKVLKNILENLISNPTSGDKNYVHDQFTPASTWVINHPLNKKVAVTATDTAGTEVEGKVTINNGNQVTIEFNFPFSGEAVLN